MEIFRWIAGFFRFRQTNWKALFLCLGAAVIFWFFSALNKENTTDIDLPLQVMADESRFMALEPVPDRLTVNVTGKGWDLLSKRLGFRVDPVVVSLEQPDKKPWLLTRTLLKDLSESAAGLRINFIHGDTIHLSYERIVTKKIRIQPDVGQLQFEEGYGLSGEATAVPDVVEVSGPVSLVKGLGTVYAVSITKKALDRSFDGKVSVFAGGSLLTSIPGEVDIRIPVERMKRMVFTAPFEIDANAQRWAVGSDSSRIEADIPESQLKDFDPGKVRVMIILRKPAADRFRMRGKISGMPENARIISADTVEVYRIKP